MSRWFVKISKCWKKYKIRRFLCGVFRKHASWRPYQTLGRLIQWQWTRERFLCHDVFFFTYENIDERYMKCWWECRLCTRNEFFMKCSCVLLLCWAIIGIRKFLVEVFRKKEICDYYRKWISDQNFFFQVSKVQFVFSSIIFFYFGQIWKKKCFRLFRDQSGEINVASLLVV